MDGLDIARQLYNAFERKDADAIRATLHDDVEWIQCQGFPNGGHHHGADEVMKNVFGKFKHEWTSFGAEVHEYLACGDRVVVLGDYVGLHRQTGKSVRAVFAHVIAFNGGRIRTFQQITDTHPIHMAMRS